MVVPFNSLVDELCGQFLIGEQFVQSNTTRQHVRLTTTGTEPRRRPGLVHDRRLNIESYTCALPSLVDRLVPTLFDCQHATYLCPAVTGAVGALASHLIRACRPIAYSVCAMQSATVNRALRLASARVEQSVVVGASVIQRSQTFSRARATVSRASGTR